MRVKKVININSQFRKNFFTSNSNDFKVSLNYELRDVVSMKLLNVQIPNTWYNISNEIGNNKFIIDSDTYIIPDGNYDSESLIDKIKGLKSDNGIRFYDASGFPTKADILVDADSGKAIFYSAYDVPMTVSFSTFGDLDERNLNTFGWTMGFRKANYTSIVSCASEGIINLGGFNYMYLVVDDNNTHSSDLVIGNLKDTYISDNILGIIRVNASNFVIVNKDDYDFPRRDYTSPVKIREFRVKMLDPNGTLINFNYMDYSFSIEFEILI